MKRQPVYTVSYTAENLAEQIILLRHRKGIGFRALADAAGICNSTLHRIEKDRWYNPRPGTIVKIFRALGYEVTPEDTTRSGPLPLREILHSHGIEIVTVEEIRPEAANVPDM